jgi:micrococcal nuclease
MRRDFYAALTLTAALALAGCGRPLDQLAAGPRGVVAAVRNGDALVLAGGQVVRLAGIEAPKGQDPFADQAREALANLVQGQTVQLYFGGARTDPYGRTLAQVKLARGGRWLQQVLLERGDVRVRTYADNRALARRMLDAEAVARRSSRGLWALRAYQVRLPEEAAVDPFGFQIVEGRVSVVDRGEGGERIDLEHWVSAEVPTRAEASFAGAGLTPGALQGRLVRVRGGLRPGSGEAVLRLDHPEQVELLKAR